METAIQKALGAGYVNQALKVKARFVVDFRNMTGNQVVAYEKLINNFLEVNSLLDSTFWQALGRVEGWADSQEPYACKGCGTIGIMDYNHTNDCPIKDRKLYWCVYWHKFIDHLAEGKSVDDFFTNLTTQK